MVAGIAGLVWDPGYRILLKYLRKPCSSLAHSHPVLPAVRGDGGVSHCPSLEYLETGGSVQERKMARIINEPRQQWPRVFPWSSSSLGTLPAAFLAACCQGLSGSTGHCFPFLLVFRPSQVQC